jgi:hypothetical protein
MLAIVYLILGFIPPMIVGPLAGLAFIFILKRRRGWYQIPFWVFLINVNFLVMFWVISSSGRWLPISTLSTFFFTPMALILTVFVMRIAWHRLKAADGVDLARKHWYTAGLLLIPALQIGMFVALIAYAPWLCKVGLGICMNL